MLSLQNAIPRHPYCPVLVTQTCVCAFQLWGCLLTTSPAPPSPSFLCSQPSCPSEHKSTSDFTSQKPKSSLSNGRGFSSPRAYPFSNNLQGLGIATRAPWEIGGPSLASLLVFNRSCLKVICKKKRHRATNHLQIHGESHQHYVDLHLGNGSMVPSCLHWRLSLGLDPELWPCSNKMASQA